MKSYIIKFKGPKKIILISELRASHRTSARLFRDFHKLLLMDACSTRNRNIKTYKALLENQAPQLIPEPCDESKGGFQRGGSREAQDRFTEYQEGTELLLRWVSFRWRS